MLERQRLAIHAHGDQRRPSIERHGGWKADRKAVNRPSNDLGGLTLHPGMINQVPYRHPLPRGIANQVAADFVGDAAQRDELLKDRETEQLGEGNAVGTFHHARDVEPPVIDVDAWNRERGVNAVEVVVGRYEL